MLGLLARQYDRLKTEPQLPLINRCVPRRLFSTQNYSLTMDFQRSRDRRRRVFLNECDTESTIDQESKTAVTQCRESGKSPRAYGSGARKREQLRTTDFIPKRPLSFAILAGILVTLGLVFTGLCGWTASQIATTESAEPFALQQITLETISQFQNWLSSVCFIVASVLSLQIFSLRRHRRDDYNGWYRLWAWLSAVLLCASACSVVNLSGFGIHLLYLATEYSLFRSGAIFWLVLNLTLIVLITSRVVYEVRQSIASAFLFSLAGLTMTTNMLLSHHWFRQQFIGEVSVLLETLLLWSALLLTIAMINFARFVYLDAHSLLKQKRSRALDKSELSKPHASQPKQNRPKKSTTPMPTNAVSSQSNQRSKVSSSVPVPAPESNSLTEGARRASKQINRDRVPSPSVVKLSDSDRNLLDADERDSTSLSKSDKRRLRKLQKRRREAA